MFSSILENHIKEYIDFPKKGVVYKDLLPILRKPKIFSELIRKMSSSIMYKKSDAIIGVDARGFIFASAIAFNSSKPMIVARKKGKLPGETFDKSYELEYGNNSLSIQKNALTDFNSFIIVDDLLATGGTANCVYKLLSDAGKSVLGLSTVIELKYLNGRSNLSFPVESQISY